VFNATFNNIMALNTKIQIHIQQYFRYIVAFCFIDGGNRSNPEKTTGLTGEVFDCTTPYITIPHPKP
jgi:hypothetical protein